MYECMYDAFSSGFSATALDKEYVSTFLATNKECFFMVFRVWCGTLSFHCLDLVSLYCKYPCIKPFPHAALVTISWLTALSE